MGFDPTFFGLAAHCSTTQPLVHVIDTSIFKLTIVNAPIDYISWALLHKGLKSLRLTLEHWLINHSITSNRRKTDVNFVTLVNKF